MTAVLALVVTAAVPDAARAQEPKATVAGGYVYFQQLTTGELSEPAYPFGWAATSALRLAGSRVSAVGEFGISYRTNEFDELHTLMAALGGARVTLYRSNRLALFAQALAGLERFAEPGFTESGIAVQPGAGVDLYVSSKVFIRAQGDYRWSQPNDATFHAYRVFAGIGVNLR